jgi:hypothetical protein
VCDNWLLKLREEYRLTVLEQVVRNTFWPKREKVVRDWRGAYKILVARPEGW